MNDEVFARASANIALAKYWGKADVARNLTAVPSLSLTLEGLDTVTGVRFDAALEDDEIRLGGTPASAKETRRVVALLDGVRTLAGSRQRARVRSVNNFPTASGLASSASGFAALALAASSAAGLSLSPEAVSALARAASASAARSLFGGWVMLGAGAEAAERIASADHLPVEMLVAVTTLGPKATGSTEGMEHSRHTSPYYAAWLAHAPALFEEIRSALLAKDLITLGEGMEQSALMMHACMWASRPPLIYFRPATLAILDRVRALRGDGLAAYATMDAGPHVKVLTSVTDADAVASALSSVEGVLRVLRARPGRDAALLRPAEALSSLGETGEA
ncbi:MAG: diphosphomevalonate decarboxylase [Polyangiaceae bacterium]